MRFLVIACFTLFAAGQLTAQGIEFFHGSWDDAIEEAKNQEKIIFVDAYTTWCGPCKRMSKNVFTQDKVGDFYNKHFVNVKLDMEKGEGLKFRKKYPVSAYPTLYYIDFTGEVVQVVRGAQSVDGFIGLGKQALDKIDRSEEYAVEYEKGNRDPKLIYNYVKALNQAGKPSLKIANDYLDEQQNLRTEDNLLIIYESTIQADSKIFEWLIEYRKPIEILVGKEAVRDRIQEACQTTVERAVEFQSEMLLEEAVDKMNKNNPKDASSFELKAQMDFYLATQDASQYLKACKKFVRKEIKEAPKELHHLATTIYQAFEKDESAMKEAEDLAEDAAELSNRYDYYLTYAYILNQNGKKQEALAAANHSMELAKSEGTQAVRMVEKMLRKIEG